MSRLYKEELTRLLGAPRALMDNPNLNPMNLNPNLNPNLSLKPPASLASLLPMNPLFPEELQRHPADFQQVNNGR